MTCHTETEDATEVIIFDVQVLTGL